GMSVSIAPAWSGASNVQVSSSDISSDQLVIQYIPQYITDQKNTPTITSGKKSAVTLKLAMWLPNEIKISVINITNVIGKHIQKNKFNFSFVLLIIIFPYTTFILTHKNTFVNTKTKNKLLI
ncbi:MAG: hypothetical protein RR374_05905, partial [Clostridia bacterium]